MKYVSVPLWATLCRTRVHRPPHHQGRAHGCNDKRCYLSADVPQRSLDELPLPEPPPRPVPRRAILRRVLDALVADQILDDRFVAELHAELDQLEHPTAPANASCAAEGGTMESVNGLGKLIEQDIENGVNVHSFEEIVTGPPKPKTDRTIPAAPLGWTPPPEETPT